MLVRHVALGCGGPPYAHARAKHSLGASLIISPPKQPRFRIHCSSVLSGAEGVNARDGSRVSESQFCRNF